MRFAFADLSQCLSPAMSCFLSLIWDWGRRTPSQREIYALPLGRGGESRKLFLHLLFLGCLQLKIILMPKWHIWGWHILIPFSTCRARIRTQTTRPLARSFHFSLFYNVKIAVHLCDTPKGLPILILEPVSLAPHSSQPS